MKAPNRKPTLNPTKSVGVKTPRTACEPDVALVATIFRIKIVANSCQGHIPCSTSIYRTVTVAADLAR